MLEILVLENWLRPYTAGCDLDHVLRVFSQEQVADSLRSGSCRLTNLAASPLGQHVFQTSVLRDSSLIGNGEGWFLIMRKGR